MKRYEITLSDEEELILKNDLLDIGAWITGAIVGKINNCKKRAARQYEEIAKKENLESMPVSDDNKVKALFARPDYKNRTARDSEQQVK